MEEKLSLSDKVIDIIGNRTCLDRFKNLVGLVWVVSLPIVVGVLLIYEPKKEREQETSYIMQIQRLEDRDGKKGYDTMILENGRELQIENKKGLLYVIEKK